MWSCLPRWRATGMSYENQRRFVPNMGSTLLSLRRVHFASVHIMIPSPPRKRKPGIAINRTIFLLSQLTPQETPKQGECHVTKRHKDKG